MSEIPTPSESPVDKSEWRCFYGGSYGREFKMPFVSAELAELDRRGELSVIVDVGCGMYPLSYEYHGKRKVILVDIAGVEVQDGDLLAMKFDIDHIADAARSETREAVKKVGEFLQIDSSEVCNPEQADLFIFSEVLNYVDYQSVIRGAMRYLKPGGRVMIVNAPNHGLQKLFSAKGVMESSELLSFLVEQGLTLEQQRHPWGETDPNHMMFIVARKSTAH